MAHLGKDESRHQPRLETLQLHAGQSPDPTTLARGVPIYQTYAFNFRDCQHAASLFAGAEGEIATRTGNPTTAVLESRLAALEGGVAAVAVASGQAAFFSAMSALARKGDNIVASEKLYHGAYNQLSFLFSDFEVGTKFVKETPEAVLEAIDDRTKAVYFETMGSSELNIPDLRAMAKAAHSKGVPLVVDNTMGAAYFCQPIRHGADIVIHSLSKWLGGHGVATGGIIIDSGNFPWQGNKRFPCLNEPYAGFHGLNFSELYKDKAYMGRVRVQMLRDVGSCLSPFNSQQFLLGIETLSLRMERHAYNALELARWLEGHAPIDWVWYPGLPSHSSYPAAQKHLKNGAGALLVFGVKGGADAGEQVCDNFKLISLNAGYGDAKSYALHPWSTTHKPLAPEEKIRIGVPAEMIRMSVGIEHIDDIKHDIEQAIQCSPAAAASS